MTELANRRAEQAEDYSAIQALPGYLERGFALHSWLYGSDWRNDRSTGLFLLIRSATSTDTDTGFFGFAPGAGPVMGTIQHLLFDRWRGSPADIGRVKDELRNFVLRYFLRIASLREPDTLPAPASAYPYCSGPEGEPSGFEFRQIAAGRAADGAPLLVPSGAAHTILDMRELGALYSWLLMRVKILRFTVAVSPFGSKGPGLSIDLPEQSHVVVSPRFIVDRDRPSPGIAGEFGLGYAFLHSSQPSLLAYGPGQFDAAFQDFIFRLHDTGEITVTMSFVANRPHAASRVSLNPLAWAATMMNGATLGVASDWFERFAKLAARLPLGSLSFDPIFGVLDGLDAASGGVSAEQFCISRERAEKQFLVQHSAQHSKTLTTVARTWRQVPDWRDDSRLPEWVIAGRKN